jgi:hypothetical protein
MGFKFFAVMMSYGIPRKSNPRPFGGSHNGDKMPRITITLTPTQLKAVKKSRKPGVLLSEHYRTLLLSTTTGAMK